LWLLISSSVLSRGGSCRVARRRGERHFPPFAGQRGAARQAPQRRTSPVTRTRTPFTRSGSARHSVHHTAAQRRSARLRQAAHKMHADCEAPNCARHARTDDGVRERVVQPPVQRAQEQHQRHKAQVQAWRDGGQAGWCVSRVAANPRLARGARAAPTGALQPAAAGARAPTAADRMMKDSVSVAVTPSRSLVSGERRGARGAAPAPAPMVASCERGGVAGGSRSTAASTAAVLAHHTPRRGERQRGRARDCSPRQAADVAPTRQQMDDLAI
jgi:hypothetical protein